MDNSFFEEI